MLRLWYAKATGYRAVKLVCWADMTERDSETYGRQATTSVDDSA